jgi:carbamoyl-phosphate synthase small subunit
LGHQVLGHALGGRTFKLKFGHRGANHPVQEASNGKMFITSQNHGFAVEGVPERVASTWFSNLYDGTNEGLLHNDLPVFSVQYHPEASPGPNDSKYLFDKFVKTL